MRRVVGVVLALTICVGTAAGAAVRNPIALLPIKVRSVFACIMWAESRSTFARLNLTDNNRYGQSGIFQIAPITWNRWAPTVGIHVPVWRATPYQQEVVAVKIWRVDGFTPWHGDGCM